MKLTDKREQGCGTGRTETPSGSLAAAWGMGSLALIGHISALLLIEAKPYAVFQHYTTWQTIAQDRPVPAWLLAAQTVVVGFVAWRLRRRLGGALARVLSPRAAALVAALAVFSQAVPTESVARSAGEVLLAGIVALVAALNLVLIALLLPDAVLARTASWVAQRITVAPEDHQVRAWDRSLPIGVALVVTMLAALSSWIVLERVPHIDDSISNYFQAKYFAAGHLFLEAPPDAESFQVDQTVVDPTRWYGYAFPAWPAVLAVGVKLGAPWLVNPILGGVLILLGHALVRRRADRGTANVVVLLLATSPWLIFMSAEFLAHPLTGVLALLAALAFDHASEGANRWLVWASLAGLAAGGLMLTRAIDAAIVIVALGVTMCVDRRVFRHWKAAVVAAVIAVATGSLMFRYNEAVTGRATYPPHMAWSDGKWGPGVDRLGFGSDIGIRAWPYLDPLPGHGPADVVLNANKNAFMTNFDLFGWAMGSLLFVWLAVGGWSWRRGDALWVGLLAAYVTGYSTYWFSGGPDLGARYWYPLLVPLAALSARGAQMTTHSLRERGTLAFAGTRVGVVMVVASLSAAAAVLPWRAVTKYYRYRGITGEVRTLARLNHFDHALVFVRSDPSDPARRDYVSAFNMNPSTLDDPATIYALDAGQAHRAAVVARLSDRPVWVIGRIAQTPGGQAQFAVLEGPLAPGSVPK